MSYGYGADWADPALIADIVPNPESHTFVQTRDRSTKLGRAWRMRPDSPDHYNDARLRSGLIPSTNGHGNARAEPVRGKAHPHESPLTMTGP